jgi:hypothetical protein
MVLEKELKNRDIVTRICDDCKGSSKTTGWLIKQGRKKHNNKDFCKKCSYKYRILEQGKMSNSPSWNGGRYLNNNGYYRVYTGNLKYEYEHKVILSKHLGRKLLPEEKIHFIDLDKINTDINNLYLCKNKNDHWKCHQSMEKCAFELFNKLIWFDINLKVYTLNEAILPVINVDISDINNLNFYLEHRRDTSGYYKRSGKIFIHKLIAERVLGRPLFKEEVIHHINGNTLDNNPSNITVMLRSEHKKCHYSLQDCISILYKKNKIGFNNGEYFLK